MRRVDKHVTYGLRADIDDWRDQIYKPTGETLRQYVDLRQWASPVEEQGYLGSCVGNAIVGAYELLLNKEAPDQFVDLSRLFVYYNARLLEGEEDTDNGAFLRNGIKGVNKYGVCKESLWPYDINKFAIKPDVASYEDAKHRNIKNYYRLINLDDILDALNNNVPVVYGMEVYENFEYLTSSQYTLGLPKDSEEAIGAHAVCLVGYDLPKKHMLVRNSFGIHWGMNGYFWITFDYIESEILDIWIFDINLI